MQVGRSALLFAEQPGPMLVLLIAAGSWYLKVHAAAHPTSPYPPSPSHPPSSLLTRLLPSNASVCLTPAVPSSTTGLSGPTVPRCLPFLVGAELEQQNSLPLRLANCSAMTPTGVRSSLSLHRLLADSPPADQFLHSVVQLSAGATTLAATCLA